jgi:hypothetical protein
MFKSWKTTLLGLGFGALNLYLSGMAGGMKPKDVAISVALTTIGAAAKDWNISHTQK